MSLTLKIVASNDQPETVGSHVIVDEDGGTIGRSDTNTLMLVDLNKIISRRHVVIAFDNGEYILTDSSLAGTFIEDSAEPINNESVTLINGMKIRIGDYTIECQVINESDPFTNPNLGNPFASNIEEQSETNISNISNPFANDEPISSEAVNNDLLGNVDDDFNNPLLAGDDHILQNDDLLSSIETEDASDLLNISENNALLDQLKPEFNEMHSNVDNSLLDTDKSDSKVLDQGLIQENISSLNDSFIPADPIKDNSVLEQGEIPDNFSFEDFFSMDTRGSEPSQIDEPIEQIKITDEPAVKAVETVQANSIKQVTPPISSSAHVSVDNSQLFHAFLKGAKLQPKEIEIDDLDEKMSRIGEMFRQFVESTVAVLRNRAEFKSLFRVSVTTIKRADNNPLKFSVTTDEALKHLINDGQGGFKNSVESIDEGFNDLLNHQLAMQAGIQASLADVLRQFDPDLIEQQYSEGMVFQKKSKCWEKYLKVHSQLSESAVDDFFGDAFSEAYEKQMKQLKG